MTAFKYSWELVPYDEAVAFMEARAAEIRAGSEGDLVWFLEHPALYTAGTSAKTADLIDARFPVFKTGRGGEYTYHGPGQRIAYVMTDLKPRGSDVRKYVCDLEGWIIAALAEFGIKGERRKGRIGIWVVTPGGEKKIAAIGVRVRKWVAYHGISINVNPDLSHYAGIVPCGISEFGVTSLHELGVQISMEEFDVALKRTWAEIPQACAA
jgi:lipoyl(octanoyl) transferase